MFSPDWPVLPAVIPEPNPPWWQAKLSAMGGLVAGWNGYSADPPAGTAVREASDLIQSLAEAGLVPTRVAPSAVGGVGVTYKVGRRRVYVEVYNDLSVYALFSDNESEPASRRVATDREGFAALAVEAITYLSS